MCRGVVFSMNDVGRWSGEDSELGIKGVNVNCMIRRLEFSS